MYNNFELYNPFVSVRLIVWAMFAGFVVASLMAVYNKRVLGGFVKSILANGCTSPDTAKTIIDLGYGTDWFIKNALRKDTVLRRFVTRVKDEADVADVANEADVADKAEKTDAEGDGESPPQPVKKAQSRHEQIDFMTARFYIPEELKYRAEVRYAGRGTDFTSFLICIIIFAVAAFAAIVVIPDLIILIDNFLGTL